MLTRVVDELAQTGSAPARNRGLVGTVCRAGSLDRSRRLCVLCLAFLTESPQMPALAEKTVDRASKLAPDVAEGPAASAELEAPTADEDLAGNGASIEAMMEAEPDDGGADGGGILDAMMGGGGSGADAPADAEPAAERELPDVGEGRVQSDEDDEWVVDLAGRRVRPGVQVVWRGEIWTVRAVDVTDSAEEEFSIDVERDGEEEELLVVK